MKTKRKLKTISKINKKQNKWHYEMDADKNNEFLKCTLGSHKEV